MEPVANLNVAPAGSRAVISFEAVTINSGVLDAKNKSIQLRLIPGQFSVRHSSRRVITYAHRSGRRSTGILEKCCAYR